MVASSAETVQTLGKYVLFEKLGEGYLGPVYRGIDQDLNRAVAVRVLCDGIKWDAKVEELFYRECHSVALLIHPNIAAIYDVGKEGQSPYYVMESLGSNSLEALIAQKSAIPVETKLSIMIQAAEGLSHAHKKGILHRDLAPAKIHITPDGSVKVRDFAITHVLKKYLPHPAVRWGAPIYLSPEQIQQKDCDERSDVFSVGTIFYELLTYYHPFHHPNGNKALDNIVLDVQIPTFEQFPDAPPGIWTVLKACLAKDPNDRYKSMDELSNACRELLKSMEEDAQLMLAELYASITPLKKAAAQRGASGCIIDLLHNIEQLSRGAGEADYTSLDRLMTVLIEQYPAIQAAAAAPNVECRQLPAAAIAVKAEQGLPEEKTENTDAAQSCESDLNPGLPAESTEIAQPQSVESVVPEEKPSCREAYPVSTGGAQPEPPQPPGISGGEQGAVKPAAAESNEDGVPLLKPSAVGEASPAAQHRRTARAYRFAALLMAMLALAATVYFVLRTEIPPPIRSAWNTLLANSRRGLHVFIPNPGSMLAGNSSGAAKTEGAPEGSEPKTASVLLKEARALAAENRFTESRVFISRILEKDPADEAAIKALKEIDEKASGTSTASSQIPRALVARVSALIDSGDLQPARKEIERLQQSYPEAPEIFALHRRLQSKSVRRVPPLRKEEEQPNAAQKLKEEEWDRRLADLFAAGKYGEASGALGVWLAENSENPRALEYGGKIEEIRRSLKAYASAMAESRYQDASNALRSVEEINPADPNLAEMRRQIEARKAAARAFLTVHRLGGKANLLLDGRAIGNEGEIENESIPIGVHTLAIENAGGLVASRSQEYLEGQRLAFVYDLAKLNLRPMSDSDRALLAKRDAIEEVHNFEVEHEHGLFRGNCRGVLSVDYLDVVYKPTSGEHGFRIPFKLLKMRGEGKTIDLFYAADSQHFQSFKLEDEQTAERFKRIWSELKAVAR